MGVHFRPTRKLKVHSDSLTFIGCLCQVAHSGFFHHILSINRNNSNSHVSICFCRPFNQKNLLFVCSCCLAYKPITDEHKVTQHGIKESLACLIQSVTNIKLQAVSNVFLHLLDDTAACFVIFFNSY